MANNTNQEVEKTIGEQMTNLLRRETKYFDIVFSVGLDEIKVKAVKLILAAASPVFKQEFDEDWENIVVGNGNGTGNGFPLPNEDPTAFQLFFDLLTLDAWSLDSINSLKLSPNNLLSLLGLCRRYKITKAIKNLEEAVVKI